MMTARRSAARILLAVLIALTATPALAQLTVEGFADTRWEYTTEESDHTFSLEAFEVDLIHSDPAREDGFMLRADIQFDDRLEAELEQAFIQAPLGEGKGNIVAGRFNAPFGLEEVDTPDLYQVSHSLVFDRGRMTSITGLSYELQVDFFELALFGGNGWDNNVDDDDAKLLGGHFSFNFDELGSSDPDRDFVVGIAYVKNVDNVDGDRDPDQLVDVTLKLITGTWTLGAELNYGEDTDATGTELEWTGLVGMVHKTFSDDTIGITVRVEWFDDDQGARGLGDTQWSYTLSPTWWFGPGVMARGELRYDKLDGGLGFVDRDGAATDDRFVATAQLVYRFEH